jgi:hypothetical protein
MIYQRAGYSYVKIMGEAVMNLQEIQAEIHALEEELLAFEWK